MHFTDYAQDFASADESTLPQHGTRPRRSVGNGRTWAIVLAAGEGARLRALTANTEGISVPKQYCSLSSGPTLLREALQRAYGIAPRRRTCVVVADQHARWWNPLELELELPAGNVIVQPENRGTANGILLALLQILERDPAARVVLLPSDHHVADEGALATALVGAVDALVDRRAEVVLLGAVPEDADPELGYIQTDGHAQRGLAQVSAFVEKPTRAHATRLIAAGALWNTFIVAANGDELLELLRSRMTYVVPAMQRCLSGRYPRIAPWLELRALYRELPAVDFSRDVAQQHPTAFHVLRIPACGWSDLGTVDRVRRALSVYGRRVARRDGGTGSVSLARALWSERLPAHAVCDLTDELGVGAVEMMPAG